MRLAAASDDGGLPDRPVDGVYLALTRMPHGEEGFDRREALALYTTGAAYAMLREQDAGTIEVGKWADFTVLSSDILAVPEEEIPGAEVLATFVGGREVYLREPFFEP